MPPYSFRKNCRSLQIPLEPRIPLLNRATAQQTISGLTRQMQNYDYYPLLIQATSQMPILEWNVYTMIHERFDIQAIVIVDRCQRTCIHGTNMLILLPSLACLLDVHTFLSDTLLFIADYFLLQRQIQVPPFYSVFALQYSFYKTRFQVSSLRQTYSTAQFLFFIQPPFHDDYYLTPCLGCNLQCNLHYQQLAFYSYNEVEDIFQPYPSLDQQVYITDVTSQISNTFRNTQVNLNFHNSRNYFRNNGQYFLVDTLPQHLRDLPQIESNRRKSVCREIFCLQEKYMYFATCQFTNFSQNEVTLKLVTRKRPFAS